LPNAITGLDDSGLTICTVLAETHKQSYVGSVSVLGRKKGFNQCPT